ncbi:MAG: HEAT repeat domain-containing protein [Candidatus Kapaibacterium sp.]
MELTKAIDDLKNNSDAVSRRTAASEIASSGVFDVDAVEALSAGLSDGDRGVRDICSQALADADGEDARLVAGKIAPMITEEDIEIRNLAGEILMRLGSAAAEALVPYLSSDDPDVRKFACDIIGIIGGTSVSEDVYKLLEDNDINVVSSAVEALGNMHEAGALDKLFAKYERHEDLKPIVIEALGKIGTEEAEEFLINLLQNEEDIFLQTAVIDALALAGRDISICHRLMEQLPYTTSELQVILLKTIYAIAFRLGEELELPENLRYIARRALMDEDPDIRAAGLVALGPSYQEEDIPGLVNEMFLSDADVQQHILYILLATSPPELVDKFLASFCQHPHPDDSMVEFLSLVAFIWDDARQDNKQQFIKTLMFLNFTHPRGNAADVVELMRKLDSRAIEREISFYLQNGNPGQKAEAMDVVDQLNLDRFIPEIEKIAASDDELRPRAKKLMNKFNII